MENQTCLEAYFQVKPRVIEIKDKIYEGPKALKQTILNVPKKQVQVVYCTTLSQNFGIYFGPRNERNTIQTTNYWNECVLSLQCILRALELSEKDQVVVIKTTCDIVVKGVNMWYKKWIVNDWKTAEGSEVKHRDLWELVLRKMQNRNVKIELVKRDKEEIKLISKALLK
jgi:ribonuclease HI